MACVSHIKLKLCSFVIKHKSRCFNLLALQNKLQRISCRSYLDIGIKSTMTKATGNRLTWDLTTETIKTNADKLIATHKKIWDDVGHVKHTEVSYENSIKVIHPRVYLCGNVKVSAVARYKISSFLKTVHINEIRESGRAFRSLIVLGKKLPL